MLSAFGREEVSGNESMAGVLSFNQTPSNRTLQRFSTVVMRPATSLATQAGEIGRADDM